MKKRVFGYKIYINRKLISLISVIIYIIVVITEVFSYLCTQN